MRFLMILPVYIWILTVSFSLHAAKLKGGGVSITLHGIVKDEGGAVVSGAKVTFHTIHLVGGHKFTDLSDKDGSFSALSRFYKPGRCYLSTEKYPYTVEKAGYVSVNDTGVIEIGCGSTVLDLGTTILISKGQAGGDVSITLNGIVKNKSGAGIGEARLIFIKNTGDPDTLLSAQNGSFSLVDKFKSSDNGNKIFKYPYTVEKTGYVSVGDTVVIDTSQSGSLVVVRGMGTIILTGDETDIRRDRFSIPAGNIPPVSEKMFTVSGRVISPAGNILTRSSAFQLVIQRDVSNQYRVTGLKNK
jgi:hypothetical protein